MLIIPTNRGFRNSFKSFRHWKLVDSIQHPLLSEDLITEGATFLANVDNLSFDPTTHSNWSLTHHHWTLLRASLDSGRVGWLTLWELYFIAYRPLIGQADESSASYWSGGWVISLWLAWNIWNVTTDTHLDCTNFDQWTAFSWSSLKYH